MDDLVQAEILLPFHALGKCMYVQHVVFFSLNGHELFFL